MCTVSKAVDAGKVAEQIHFQCQVQLQPKLFVLDSKTNTFYLPVASTQEYQALLGKKFILAMEQIVLQPSTLTLVYIANSKHVASSDLSALFKDMFGMSFAPLVQEYSQEYSSVALPFEYIQHIPPSVR